MNFIKRVLICSIIAFVMLNTVSCNSISINNNVREKIEALDYEIEQNGNEYTLTDEDTQFVIKINFGKAELKSITKELSPHGDMDVIDNVGMITIKPINSKYVEVSLDDTVPETFNNGNSMNFDEHISVVCGTDFTEESIDPNDSVSILGKATKYLNHITTYWMSAEELQELYAKGIDIVNSINQ